MPRLIDANKLIAKWKPIVKRYEGNNTYWETVFVLEGVIEDVENEPTVDAEPVKHGYWIKRGGWYWCSECGDHWGDDGANYCPNCGAKMDEVTEDAETD